MPLFHREIPKPAQRVLPREQTLGLFCRGVYAITKTLMDQHRHGSRVLVISLRHAALAIKMGSFLALVRLHTLAASP